MIIIFNEYGYIYWHFVKTYYILLHVTNYFFTEVFKIQRNLNFCFDKPTQVK